MSKYVNKPMLEYIEIHKSNSIPHWYYTFHEKTENSPCLLLCQTQRFELQLPLTLLHSSLYLLQSTCLSWPPKSTQVNLPGNRGWYWVPPSCRRSNTRSPVSCPIYPYQRKHEIKWGWEVRFYIHIREITGHGTAEVFDAHSFPRTFAYIVLLFVKCQTRTHQL